MPRKWAAVLLLVTRFASRIGHGQRLLEPRQRRLCVLAEAPLKSLLQRHLVVLRCSNLSEDLLRTKKSASSLPGILIPIGKLMEDRGMGDFHGFQRHLLEPGRRQQQGQICPHKVMKTRTEEIISYRVCAFHAAV